MKSLSDILSYLLESLPLGQDGDDAENSQNTHEELISRTLSELEFRGGEGVDKTLVLLAFVNRSGSNLFGEYLSTLEGYFGFREELNAKVVLNTCEKYGFQSFPDYMRAISCRQAGSTFGLKASGHQIQMLYKWGVLAMFSQVKAFHIMRHDVIAQAVSLWFAKHTEQWSSRHRPIRSEDDIPYDFEQIARICADIENKNLEIRMTLSALDIPTHSLHYEDLVSKPRVEMRRAGRFLRVDVEGWTPPDTIRHEKQVSDVKDAFVTRFREDCIRGWNR